MRVGIVGLGYVGLTLAIALSAHDVEVHGIEVNPHILACLKERKAHFFEPGLDELIEQVSGTTFFFSEKFEAGEAYDAFVITVGTPLKAGAKQPNFEYIKSAMEALKDVYTGKELVILRSTVSVGTTRKIVLPYLAQMTGKPESELFVAMCPERTVEGKAVEELTNLPQVISGNNKTALDVAKTLFGHLTSKIVAMDSLEEAELVKLYCNTYRDMRFALGNALCMAAETFDVDGTKVIRAANRDYPRADIPLPGFVAGPCLEKDAYILTNNMPEGRSRDFILSARHFNEFLEDVVVDWVNRKTDHGARGKVVALSGMAFKGQPETSDLRGSSSVYIARKLVKAGYQLRLHDFTAKKEEMQDLGLGDVFESLPEVCEGASVLLILNNHVKYKDLAPFDAIADKKCPVLDTWDVCEHLADGDVDRFTLGNACVGEEVQL